MFVDGYVAWWRNTRYEASPSGENEVRLYATQPVEGFEEVRPGRYRRVVPTTELDDFRYVRTACEWRGEPFIVVGEHDRWLRVEYTGGKAPVAERLGLDRIDFGVWQAWAPREEVQNLREEFVQ